MNGRELAKDLAASIENDQWMTWVELPLGPVTTDDRSSPKADVLAVLKSFANPRFVIYEVKVARSDFLADCARGKYQQYMKYCTQFYFATPAGLVKKEEVPPRCGLIVKGELGWHSLKAGTRNDFEPSTELMLKLLMRGFENHQQKYRDLAKKDLTESMGVVEAARRHGIKIAETLANADEIIRTAKELTDEIGTLMGRKYDSLYNAAWALKSDVNRLMAQKRYGPQAVKLITMADHLFEGGFWEVSRSLRQIADDLDAEGKASVL